MLSLFLVAMRPLALLFPSLYMNWPLTLMSSRSCRRRLMRLSPIRWVMIPGERGGRWSLHMIVFSPLLRRFCPKHKHQIIYLHSQVVQWKRIQTNSKHLFLWCLHLLFRHYIVSDSVTPWTAARQASLSLTISQSLLRLVSVEAMMPSNDPILCHPLILPSIFPSIRVFSS